MPTTQSRLRRYCILLLSLLLIALPEAVSSQQAGQVIITRIDTSDFPAVHLYLAASDPSGNALNAISRSTVQVREDGAITNLEEPRRENVGIVASILVDASGNLVQLPGGTGKLRLEEARDAILELANSATWLDKTGRTDWLTVLVPDERGEARKLVPAGSASLTNDYLDLRNTLQSYKPGILGNTPLFKLLLQALKTLTEDPTKEAQRKMILVFSDGINAFDDIKLQDAIQSAREKNIPIFTVYHGPQERITAQSNPDNLRRLSLLTEAQYVWYTGPEVMTNVYRQMTGLRQQYILTYRSKLNAGGKHILRVDVGDPSKPMQTAQKEFAVALEPPKVRILEPSNNLRFERTFPTADSKLEEAQPNKLAVRVEVSFPDNHPRQIVKVEQITDGKPLPGSSNPSFQWDMSSLATGSHSLRVRVIDELGLVGESDLIKVEVVTQKPSQSGPVQLGPVQSQSTQPWGISDLAIPLSISLLMAAGVIGFIIFRRRHAATAEQEPYTLGETRTVTLDGETLGPRFEVVRGEYNGVTPIKVEGGTKIGRDKTWANVIFEDMTVGRTQATIRENPKGVFYILNLGKKNRTRVNGEEVTEEGRQLRDGDEVQLGDVQLRFNSESGETEALTIVSQREGETIDLEEYDPRTQSMTKALSDNRPSSNENDDTEPMI